MLTTRSTGLRQSVHKLQLCSSHMAVLCTIYIYPSVAWWAHTPLGMSRPYLQPPINLSSFLPERDILAPPVYVKWVTVANLRHFFQINSRKNDSSRGGCADQTLPARNEGRWFFHATRATTFTPISLAIPVYFVSVLIQNIPVKARTRVALTSCVRIQTSSNKLIDSEPGVTR